MTITVANKATGAEGTASPIEQLALTGDLPAGLFYELSGDIAQFALTVL